MNKKHNDTKGKLLSIQLNSIRLGGHGYGLGVGLISLVPTWSKISDFNISISHVQWAMLAHLGFR